MSQKTTLSAETNIETKRHSLAHLLASAIKELWPKAKLAIGPAIDNGFYYDIDFGETKISEVDLKDIEKKIAHLTKQNLKFEQSELPIDEGTKKAEAEGEIYKAELIRDLKAKGETLVSYYTVGKFTDLCCGPHIESTGQIKPGSFKLDKLAGAYWRGDEKNKMLTRLYGLAFETKEELNKHLEMIAEAEKRDHRKLGKELDLFIFSDLVGPGLPIYTFKGAIIRREIINLSNELQSEIGYQEVHTPNINKADLFKVSGHFEKYKEDMLKVISNYTKEEYYLKPMNCPQHTQVYASHLRSYKDLPIRIADFANLYRDEKPGELSGLVRLRSFCQDDGHCFCRPDQIKEEFQSVLGAIKKALTVYKMDYYIRLSLWDPSQPKKYLGESAVWEESQAILKNILEENKLTYVTSVGEAAIYGPKMDIMTKDSLGREWQISTIQLDLIMPSRFGLKYIDQDGSEKTPIMIHRALIGSPERFLGILIEHYAGNFPTWLAPVQVKILPISKNQLDYAQEILTEFKKENIRTELDENNETLGKKIRSAKMQKIPYLIVIGEKEVEEKMITVEIRGGEKNEKLKLTKFIEKISAEIKNRS